MATIADGLYGRHLVDWAKEPDNVLEMGVVNGDPDALAEVERRYKAGRYTPPAGDGRDLR